MLWALAFLGIIPAAFAFGDSESGDADGESLSANENAEPDENTDENTTDTLDDSDQQPTHHDAMSNGLETTYEGFAIGEDQITLHLTDDGSGEFTVDSMQDADGESVGVSLSYFDGESETTLNFLGLDEVPAEDIVIGVTSQEAGEEALYTLESIGDFGALSPQDPEEPATPSGQANSEDTIVIPNAPIGDDQVFDHVLAEGGDTLVLNDDPFQGGFDAHIVKSGDTAVIETDHALHQIVGNDDGDTIVLGDDAAIVHAGAGDDSIYAGEGTAIVSGGDGEDAIFGGDDSDSDSDYLLDGGAGDDDLSGGEADEVLIGGLGADSISGGGGDDTLMLDAQDVATGGTGDDTFWLYSDGESDTGFAQITDFSQGEDIIRITLPLEAEDTDDFDVEVTQTNDGTGSEVSVNGDVIAVLHGAPNVTASDIVVDYTT